MNSASRGGRAAKNAIDACNHTANITHVKVLSRANSPHFVDDLSLKTLLRFIKEWIAPMRMQNCHVLFTDEKNAPGLRPGLLLTMEFHPAP
jgi:hypothetical protein